MATKRPSSSDSRFDLKYCYVRYYDAAKILRTRKLTKEMNWRLLATISRHFIDFGSAISLLKTVVLLCFRSIVIVKMVEMLLEMFYLCFISSDNNFIQRNLRKSNRKITHENKSDFTWPSWKENHSSINIARSGAPWPKNRKISWENDNVCHMTSSTIVCL